MYRILVVEDELQLQEAIYDYLTAKGMTVQCTDDGKKAMEFIETQTYDLLLLDVMVPGINGFEICKQVRKEKNMPIIFITARCSEEDQLHGFGVGADDYVIKPFSLPVLFSKCSVLIKRHKGEKQENLLIYKKLVLNLNTRQLHINGSEVSLPPKEYDMLRYFLENKNQVLTRDQLLNHVWGFDYFGDSRVVDTHIKKLRKLLAAYGKQIETVIKVGYRFVWEVDS